MSSVAVTSSESRQLRRPREPRALGSLLLGAGFTLATSAAYAQPGSACNEQRVRVEGTLAPQWLEPVVKLCETLASMPDVDASAQLRVVGAGDDVIVEVTLGDGRSTLRRVRAPSDLPLTVEALVAVPPESAAPPATSRLVARPEPVAPAPTPRLEFGPALGVHPVRHVTIEVGATLVGRVAGNPIYLSIGLTGYAGLRSGPWLLALLARWDGYQNVMDERPKDFEMTTAGGGVEVLRRLVERSDFALEGGLTAWLLGETQAHRVEGEEHAGSIVDTRLGLLSRALFGEGPLRYLVTFDAELSPARVHRDLHIERGLPILPGYSVGFGGGVAWEVP